VTDKKWKETALVATVLKPGLFAVGSPQSRAAARALLSQREQGIEQKVSVAIGLIGHLPRDCGGKACVGTCELLTHEWQVSDDGTPYFTNTKG
jgi:hypothetical protein